MRRPLIGVCLALFSLFRPASQELHLFDGGYIVDGEKHFWIEYRTCATELRGEGGFKLSFRQPAEPEALRTRYGLAISGSVEGKDAGFDFDELRGEGIVIHVVRKSAQNPTRWISRIRIESPKYSLGNGLRVGMKISELESITGLKFEDEDLTFHVSGMDFPARYKYEVDDSPIDPLVSYLRITRRGDLIAGMEFYVEPTVNM